MELCEGGIRCISSTAQSQLGRLLVEVEASWERLVVILKVIVKVHLILEILWSQGLPLLNNTWKAATGVTLCNVSTLSCELVCISS